jgi:hypothetical protein
MPFAKGKSGNPSGRPKKEHSLTGILEKLGELADISMSGKKISRKQALAEAIWQKAIVEKDMAAIRYIYDRIDGQPVATQNIGGADGGALEILIKYADKPK